MDAQHLQFADESFDAIVSRNVLWNLEDPAMAYREMYRVLRPGGTILVEDGNMYLYLYDEAYEKLHNQYMEEQKKNCRDQPAWKIQCGSRRFFSDRKDCGRASDEQKEKTTVGF